MGGLVYTMLVNILEWPYPEECTAAAMFQSGVLMAVMANISLSFLEKVIRLVISFALASYVSIQSPHSVYFEDTFPILGATILGAIFVLYIYHFGVNRTLATVQGARLILASLFVHHAAVTLTSPDKSAYENIASFVKAVLVVSVGIVATGTFQNEILQKESLEIQVRNRTQNLHMVNMALQASETAIAITDKQGCIIWLNAAFERLAGESEEKLRGLILKDVIHELDSTRNENKSLLIESYDDPSKRSERDLQIGESIYQLDATPFLSEGYSRDNIATNDRFLMVFKNITAGRAREVAEKKAQDEAMMAKAMGESMLTLTHELRTPLQGIMGVTSSLLQQASGLSNDALESLKLIMASSSLLLNLINNLLDVKKANAKSESKQHGAEKYTMIAISECISF
jgi:PAS domain S-box-containing protein